MIYHLKFSLNMVAHQPQSQVTMAGIKVMSNLLSDEGQVHTLTHFLPHINNPKYLRLAIMFVVLV